LRIADVGSSFPLHFAATRPEFVCARLSLAFIQDRDARDSCIIYGALGVLIASAVYIILRRLLYTFAGLELP
jgi:hypothetical protein